MKVESTNRTPKFNLLASDGVRDQTEADEINFVMIDGLWRTIIPGSFKFYVTTGAKPVPFVQFDMVNSPGTGGLDPECYYRCEVFPTAIMGVAYAIPAPGHG